MIPSANLSDFEQKELVLLALAVDDKIKTCQNNIETLLKFDDSDFKTGQLAYWNGHLDTYSLWATQIGNAMYHVKCRDSVKYN
jgi:hypothetical protein